MHPLHRSSLIATVALVFAACERKTIVVVEQPPEPIARTNTAETTRLGDAVDAYSSEPTSPNAAAVSTALAKLDGEIAELQERVATKAGNEREEAAAKLRNLQGYRAAEAARFAAAQARARVPVAPGADARSGAEKLENSTRRVGEKIEDGAKSAGDAVEDAAKKTGNAVKDIAR